MNKENNNESVTVGHTTYQILMLPTLNKIIGKMECIMDEFLEKTLRNQYANQCASHFLLTLMTAGIYVQKKAKGGKVKHSGQ